MRLYVKHIWRAFPELDSYSDGRCSRFTRAARRGRPLWMRLWHWGLQGVALAGGVVAAFYVARAVHGALVSSDQVLWRTYAAQIGVAVLFLVGVAVSMLAMFSLGHWLLRRRIAWVLRERGRCPQCTYSMIGLPVARNLDVVCPECGYTTKVEAALGELATGADGTARYEPSHAEYRRWDWSAFRRKAWKVAKRGGVGVAIVGVVVAGVYGTYEWRLRGQAARARAMPRGDEAMAALLASVGERVVRRTSPESDVQLLDAVSERVMAIRQRVMSDAGSLHYTSVDGSDIFQREKPDPRSADEYTVNEELALGALDQMEREGVFGDLRDALKRCSIAPPVQRTENELLLQGVNGDMTRQGAIRNLARWCAARMRRAERQGDPSAFAAALEDALGLAEVQERKATVADRINSYAIEALTHSEVRAVLATHPDARWLDAIGGAIERHPLGGRPGLPYQGELVVWRDVARWMFSDPSRVRWGAANTKLQRRLRGLGFAAPKVGTLEENVDAAEAFFGAMAKRAAQPPWQRAAPPPLPAGGLAINVQVGAMEATLSSDDRATADRLGTRTLLALERYLASHGDYPDSLDAMAGREISVLPVDPCTGKTLCYKPAEAKPGKIRTFVLYTAGPDGVDNGGNRHPRQYEVWSSRAPAGYDYIFNDAEP